MKSRRIIIDDEAKRDLRRLRDWITRESSPRIARAYSRRLRAYMETLSAASERGLSRPDIIPGLRVIGFGRTTIAVVVEDDVAVVIRVFHGGQDWERALKGDDT